MENIWQFPPVEKLDMLEPFGPKKWGAPNKAKLRVSLMGGFFFLCSALRVARASDTLPPLPVPFAVLRSFRAVPFQSAMTW